MKWSNKGHEFDEQGRFLSGIKTVYLWGAWDNGKTHNDRFIWLGIEKDFKIIFVDSSIEKQKHQFCGRLVISPSDFISEFRDDGTMVLLITLTRKKALYDIYTDWDFESNAEIIQGKNCFASTENRAQILREFFSVLMMYRYNKLFSTIQDVIATTKCTLNCNRCLNYTMLNKNKRHFPIDELKSDVNTLFSKVDYVDMLNISGGEPLTHNDINDLIDYIGRNYRSRIYEFLFLTNGTVIPSSSTVEIMAEHKCLVRIDDYRNSVPACNERIPEIIRLLDMYGVKYYLWQTDEWIDVAHDSTVNFYMNSDKLISYFNYCESPCKYVKNGKLYGCNYQAFAVEAGIAKEYESDFIYIEEATKMEILEFLLGYSEKGYVDYCKHCSGFFTINKNRIRAAEQI